MLCPFNRIGEVFCVSSIGLNNFRQIFFCLLLGSIKHQVLLFKSLVQLKWKGPPKGTKLHTTYQPRKCNTLLKNEWEFTQGGRNVLPIMAFNKVKEETDFLDMWQKIHAESKQKVKNAIVRAGELANSTCDSILIGKMLLIVSKDGCPCWQLPTVFIEVELVTSLIHKEDCLESTFNLLFPNAWLPPNL